MILKFIQNLFEFKADVYIVYCSLIYSAALAASLSASKLGTAHYMMQSGYITSMEDIQVISLRCTFNRAMYTIHSPCSCDHFEMRRTYVGPLVPEQLGSPTHNRAGEPDQSQSCDYAFKTKKDSLEQHSKFSGNNPKYGP